MRTVLHVKGTIRGEFADSRATVLETSPDQAEICLRLFDETDGPNWICKFSVGNSRFWLTDSIRKTNMDAQDSWWEFLRIRQSDGSEIQIGEELAAASSRAN
jgi:hypothetical protein